MENKKNNIIAFRLDDKLNQLLNERAIKETVKRNKIIKISDIIREILEDGVK